MPGAAGTEGRSSEKARGWPGLNQGARPLKETRSTSTLILDSQPPELRGNKCLLFTPPAWYSVTAALADTCQGPGLGLSNVSRDLRTEQ